MIVVDASTVIEVLLGTDRAGPIRERLSRPRLTLHCPELLDLEVLQVIRRYLRAEELDVSRGSQLLSDLRGLPLVRYSHEPLLARIWELRDNLTAYDAAYIALAEALDAPLVTRDARLAASPGLRATVEVI